MNVFLMCLFSVKTDKMNDEDLCLPYLYSTPHFILQFKTMFVIDVNLCVENVLVVLSITFSKKTKHVKTGSTFFSFFFE